MTTAWHYAPSPLSEFDSLVSQINALRDQLDDLDGRVNSHGSQHVTVTGIDPVRHKWRRYSPLIVGGTTSPTYGTDPIRWGRWHRVTDLIVCHFYIQFGTGGTVDPGAGNYAVSLPAKMHAGYPSARIALGVFRLHDASTGTEEMGVVQGGPDTATVYLRTAAGAAVAAGSPWTWAASDSVGGTITYRAAGG